MNPPAVGHRKPDSPMLGATLANVFSTRDYHCQLAGAREKPEFAVTRLRSGPGPTEKAPACATDDAFLVWVSLTPAAIGQWRARYNGREVGVTRGMAFATTVLDLSRPMEMWIRGPFDYFHYYLAASLLKRVAFENEISTTYELRESFFVEDLVVAQLTRSILSPVRHGEPLNELALEELALLMSAHVLQRYCGSIKVAASARRGLQTWQKLRVEEILRAQLHGNLTLNELATACSLSVRHFSRGFRHSFGISVHQYLIRLRLERAKTLLAKTKKPLAEVAHLCGFCDQPAFTRAFRKVERMPPLLWRKTNG